MENFNLYQVYDADGEPNGLYQTKLSSEEFEKHYDEFEYQWKVGMPWNEVIGCFDDYIVEHHLPIERVFVTEEFYKTW